MPYDLAYLGVPGSTTGVLQFDDTMCEGAYTLAQRVLALMFTDASNPYSLGFGSNLPNDIPGANNFDPGQLKGVFDIAAKRVTNNIQQTTAPGTPLESQLERIEILVPESSMEGDTAGVEVTVLTRAKTAVTIKVPVKPRT